ncbi:hypothetical protein BJ944DRAFT_171969 [Cunninghamella echinulata]|nr:hypothetical protein BJ944DRAFT_171969 [Cunninghamella echinulata]
MHHVPRRLSSGSACETCRRRKTKCDGGQPCAFCSSNNIECIHRPSRRKRSLPKYNHHPHRSPWSSISPPPLPNPTSSSLTDSSSSLSSSPSSPQPNLMKQISCPSLFLNSKKMEMPSMMGK